MELTASLLKEGEIRDFASLMAQMVKNLPAVQETWVRSLSWEDPLEEGMAVHSSILAWRIPMDRGSWQATVHGVGKSQARLSRHVIIEAESRNELASIKLNKDFTRSFSYIYPKELTLSKAANIFLEELKTYTQCPNSQHE